MKLLVVAQLPARLARFVADAGHDVVHTSALPDGNGTSDIQIATMADGEARVVVTKDRDFRDGHLLSGSPRRLLVVATGNITNTALVAIFEANIAAVVAAFDDTDFVELGPDVIVVHARRASS
ncbi:MAG: DUF5615 family PIN-like protein [Phycicoccus sp.]